MHVGLPGKKSKVEDMYCSAWVSAYGDGGTSDLVLDCGGTASFTQTFAYLGFLLHCGLLDHHSEDVRIKKAARASGALRDRVFSSHVPERLKGKVYAGGVLAVLMFGCDSWCPTAEVITRLRSWHNKAHSRDV
jgi:hypothetical protein